ncbi:MAG TPA: hypothetical protein PLX79_01530 [Candidatus Dojkabacteria bacterium]|nr:hypothetical protein [Candidatus Dojkabacteria bacterium]
MLWAFCGFIILFIGIGVAFIYLSTKGSKSENDNIKNSSSLTTKSANKSTDSNKKVAQLINSKTAIKDSKIEKSELSSKKLSIKKNPKNTKSTIKSSAKSDAKKRNQKNIKNTKSSTK